MSIASDYELALRLQSEFNNSINHVPPAKKAKKDQSKANKDLTVDKKDKASIVDTDWERLDPNPDIYVLFQTFDNKFFWGNLVSVEVKWSKRMYSCAGVCTYKGKRGGCCISLSLPLLQLRPRKDLVETLLHEMIHAYLFLTANNQEREEHGPQFHEHMHRINKAAGTKITVYHTFHDEVAHYKQHWWRCNGPCQSRKPFFGLVKRSMNRAPGPHDFWFAEHKATCGGEFVKIKEPENFKARKSRTKVKDESSLTKYFPKHLESSSLPTSKVNDAKKRNKSPRIKESETGNGNAVSNNLTSLTKYFPKVPSSLASSSKTGELNKDKSLSGIKGTETNNIHGFSSLKNNSSQNSIPDGGNKVNSIKPTVAGFGAGLKSNKGGTLIMNPRPGSSEKSDERVNSPKKQEIVPFSGAGHVLGGVADRSKSVLLSMFENAQKTQANKGDTFCESKKNGIEKNKIKQKPGTENKSSSIYKNNEPKASSSGKSHNRKESNGSTTSEVFSKRANSSTTEVVSVSKEVKKEEIVEIKSDSDEENVEGSENIVSCPVCGFQTLDSLINEHLDECAGLQTVLENVQILDDDTEFEVPNQVQCPSCGFMCLEDEINIHLDACLT